MSTAPKHTVTKATTWQDVYTILMERSKLTSHMLADIVGINRGTLYQITAGTYKYVHQPRFSNGIAVLNELRRLPDAGKLVNRTCVTKDGQFIPKPYEP